MTTNSRPEDKRYESRGKLKLSGKDFNYEATAAWLSLKDGDNRKADVFHTYYRQPRRAGGKRPLTFVFNGGPGAASGWYCTEKTGRSDIRIPQFDPSKSETWVSLTPLGRVWAWL